MSTAHDRPFEPEPTPLLEDVSAPVRSVSTDTEWVGEKTILIADDAPAAAFLHVSSTDQWITLREFPAVLGRHELASIRLDDPSVSRRHAQIALEGDHTFVVEDLGSSNGIRVEGQRVERMLLMDGDRFELGRIGLRFSTQAPADAMTPSHTATSVSLPRAPTAPDPANEFDLKKFLPLAVSIAAVAVALSMYLNRAPRTLLLPAPEPPVELAPATPVDVPFDRAITPASVDESAVVEPVTPAPANLEETNAPETQLKALTMTETLADNSVVEVSAPVEIAQAAPDQALATQRDTLAPVPNSRPIEAPFQEELAAAPKVTPRARPPAKPKPVRRSSDFSRAYIDTALQMYLDGDSDNAIRRLGIMSRSLRNQRQFRDEAAGLQLQVEALVTNYKQGQSALDRGDRAEAAASWARFLRDEAQLFGGSTSVYAKRISRVVAEQYIRDGDTANAEGRFHDAHGSWTKALQYTPDGVAKESLARLEQRGQELFREGYRLESVSLERAKVLWTEVTEILPPGTEYHTKARAKLRWHEQGGRQ